MNAAATKRALAISCVGFALACAPAATTTAPVEPALSVPPLGDGGAISTHDGIRFGRVPSTAGQRWTVSTRAESRTANGDQVARYESDYTVEVLGVDGPAPSRVALRFDRNVNVFGEAERPTVVDGKSYVVASTVPNVREASGAAAPEAEAERVLDVVPDLGTRARIDEVLPEDAMAIGDRRDELAAAILRVIHPRAWHLEKGSATLARLDGDRAGDHAGDRAVFTVAIVAESRQGVRMSVTGEAHVRLRDARLVLLDLRGDYDHGDAGARDATNGGFTLRRVVRDR